MSNKSSKAEVDQRIHAIYLLLLRRESSQSICRYAAEKWGASQRQTERYIAAARNRMAEEAKVDREVARAEHLALRRDLFNKSYREEKWAIAFQIAQDEAKLLGLYFTLSDHMRSVLSAGYQVFEPGSAEAAAAAREIADTEFEVEIGLAQPTECVNSENSAADWAIASEGEHEAEVGSAPEATGDPPE